jgi:hypothetical protein
MRLLYLPLILVPFYQVFRISIARKRFLLGGVTICVSLPLAIIFMLRMPILSHSIALPLVLLANCSLWGVLAYECYCRDLIVAHR